MLAIRLHCHRRPNWLSSESARSATISGAKCAAAVAVQYNLSCYQLQATSIESGIVNGRSNEMIRSTFLIVLLDGELVCQGAEAYNW